MMIQRELTPTDFDLQGFVDDHGDEGWFLAELFNRFGDRAPAGLINTQTGLDEQDYQPFIDKWSVELARALYEEDALQWVMESAVPYLELKA